MPAKLSTHVLDTAHGCPAQGMKIELWSLDGEERTLVTTAKTNADGRTDQPLLSAEEMKAGQHDFVLAGFHFLGGEQRLVGAPVGIGFGRRDERALLAVERPQFDFHPLRRTAVRGVQNVRAEFGGHKLRGDSSRL